MCSSSSALSKPASAGRHINPVHAKASAIAGSQCFIQVKADRPSIGVPCLKKFLEPGRSRLAFIFDEPTLFLDFRLDVVMVVVSSS